MTDPSTFLTAALSCLAKAQNAEHTRSTMTVAEPGVMEYLRQESCNSACLPSAEEASIEEQTVGRSAFLLASFNIDAQSQPIENACICFAGDRVNLTVNHHD